jgi:hypothetical protein
MASRYKASAPRHAAVITPGASREASQYWPLSVATEKARRRATQKALRMNWRGMRPQGDVALAHRYARPLPANPVEGAAVSVALTQLVTF